MFETVNGTLNADTLPPQIANIRIGHMRQFRKVIHLFNLLEYRTAPTCLYNAPRQVQHTILAHQKKNLWLRCARPSAYRWISVGVLTGDRTFGLRHTRESGSAGTSPRHTNFDAMASKQRIGETFRLHVRYRWRYVPGRKIAQSSATCLFGVKRDQRPSSLRHAKSPLSIFDASLVTLSVSNCPEFISAEFATLS